jgi:hypothetical protein
MLRSYCFGNGSTTFNGLKIEISPRFQACIREQSARTKGMKRKIKRGVAGENQTNAGGVSNTSPLQRNVLVFSQAIGSQASRRKTSSASGMTK